MALPPARRGAGETELRWQRSVQRAALGLDEGLLLLAGEAAEAVDRPRAGLARVPALELVPPRRLARLEP